MCNEVARRTSLGLMREDFNQLRIPLSLPDGAPNLGEAPSIRITDTSVIVRASQDGIVHAAPRDGAAPADESASEFEMVQRRWSWVGASANGRPGKPVYNYRSEGRRFGNSAPGETGYGRCLIPLDGFYEFTDGGDVVGAVSGDVSSGAPTLSLPLDEPPAPPAKGAGAKARKAKWLFTLAPDTAWNPRARAAPGLFAVAGLWRAGVDLGKAGTGEAWTMLTCAPGPDIAPYHSRQIVLMPRDRWADWLAGEVPAADLIALTPAGMLRVERVD